MKINIYVFIVFGVLLVSYQLDSFFESEIASELADIYSFYEKNGRVEDAQYYYDLAIKEGSIQALVLNACKQVRANNIEKARELFQEIEARGYSLGQAGLCLINHDMEGAFRALCAFKNELIENAPDDFEIDDAMSNELLFADIICSLGDNFDTEHYYKKAIELGGGGDSYSKLAYYYKKQKKYDLAVGYYEKARENKEDSFLICSLGAVYYKQGKLDLAQTFFETEEQVSPLKKSLYLSLIHYSKGDCQLGKYYFDQLGIDSIDSTDPLKIKRHAKQEFLRKMEACSLNDLADAYFYAQRYQEALVYYFKSYALEKSAWVMWNISQTCRRLGKLDLVFKF